MSLVSMQREPLSGSTVARWSTAALLVAGAHAGAVWIAINWTQPQVPPGVPDSAIMIELEPLAVSETPPAEAPPGPEVKQDEPQPEPMEKPPEPEPAPPEPTPPEPVVEPPPPTPEPPMPEPPPPEPVPAPPPSPVISEAVLPPPPPPPKPVVKKVERKIEKPVEKPRERKPVPQQRTAPPATEQRAQVARNAPSAGAATASPAARANWQSLVAAHLNRFKRPSANGATGTARVAFRIGAGGQVLSASLAGSSGDPALDQEAVALVRRASPVPAPPPEMGGGIALAVPVRFTR